MVILTYAYGYPLVSRDVAWRVYYYKDDRMPSLWIDVGNKIQSYNSSTGFQYPTNTTPSRHPLTLLTNHYIPYRHRLTIMSSSTSQQNNKVTSDAVSEVTLMDNASIYSTAGMLIPDKQSDTLFRDDKHLQ